MTHPILFQPDMVRAIISGTKTQTRREVTERNSVCTEAFDNLNLNEAEHFFEPRYLTVPRPSDFTRHLIFCKYEIDDVLWVRETWKWEGDTSYTDLLRVGHFMYKADDPDNLVLGYKPSIHMPKEACRLWLRITDIRVQRVQEITDWDAKAEGVEMGFCQQQNNGTDLITYKNYSTGKQELIHPSVSFHTLWQNINGPESWLANPWAWAISFKRCEMPKDFLTEKK